MPPGEADRPAEPAVEPPPATQGGEEVDDQREATELAAYPPTHGAAESAGRSRSQPGRHRVSASLATFWKRHVALTVPHDDCRDHFGKSWCDDFV